MKKVSLSLFLLGTIVLSGCSFQNNTQAPSISGIYKSFDKGDTWQTKNTLVLPGRLGSMNGVNVNTMQFDPQDSNAIYIGSQEGMFYTFDGGENWFRPNQLAAGAVHSISIDAKNKCTIYVAFGNRVLKTVDCNRNFSEIYVDSRPTNVAQVAVDSKNSQIVYVVTGEGELLKSFNGGATWSTIYRFSALVNQLLVYPLDTNIMYAAISGQGLFKSVNAGQEWVQINDSLRKFSGFETHKLLLPFAGQANLIYYLNAYGIMRTNNAGLNWTALNLITPPVSTNIRGMAINPQNSNEIHYVTSNTLYSTTNSGQTWSIKRLQQVQSTPSYVLIDPINPNIIYLGTKALTQ